MQLRDEGPHLRLILNDGSWLGFPLSERDSVLAAWQGREAFWSGVDLWGERIHVKLAIVTNICERSQAVLDLIAAEAAERKQRELISGEAA